MHLFSLNADEASKLLKEGYRVYRSVNGGKPRQLSFLWADDLVDDSKYDYYTDWEK